MVGHHREGGPEGRTPPQHPSGVQRSQLPRTALGHRYLQRKSHDVTGRHPQASADLAHTLADMLNIQFNSPAGILSFPGHTAPNLQQIQLHIPCIFSPLWFCFLRGGPSRWGRPGLAITALNWPAFVTAVPGKPEVTEKKSTYMCSSLQSGKQIDKISSESRVFAFQLGCVRVFFQGSAFVSDQHHRTIHIMSLATEQRIARLELSNMPYDVMMYDQSLQKESPSE